MESDSELLQLFACQGREPAFQKLVERHAAMVKGVALRTAGDAALADEVTQTVFTILARKARSLASRENLAGWLHNSAFLEARNASRKAARYRKTLHHYQLEMNTSSPEPAEIDLWEEIRPHLDEALSRLPENARSLIVLRYHEKLSMKEIAGVTGKSAEASRKEIERAVEKLGSALRKRGIASTGAGLGAVFMARNLCVTPASAAAITSAALKASPALSLATLTAFSFRIMDTATIAKTAAITLLIASFPIVMLWQRNAEQEAALWKLQAATYQAPNLPTAEASDGSSSGLNNVAKAAPATAPGSPPADIDESAMQQLTEKARVKSKRLADLEFTRLCLNLPDLTDDQESRIQAALETKSQATLETILGTFQSGAVAKAVNGDGKIGDQEKAVLATLDPRQMKKITLDEELRTILTADQYAEHLKRQEEKRVSEAEEAAGERLKFIGRSFDLSPEQKDRIFQKLAQLELATPANSGENAKDLLPMIGSRDEARDQAIRENLNPQQAEVFDRSRAAEKETLRQQMMEFYDQQAAGKPQ